MRDIRERLRAEEERRSLLEDLLHAQKMESIGRLAGGVAHDFNNLLLVILANAQLLRRKLANDDQVELDGIVTAGERASTLTRQLLSFSRRRVLEPVVLDVSEIVHTMSPVLDRMLGDAIRLDLQLSPTPCWVLADAGQLEQVILNLSVNARDAMAGGGTLKIETTAPSRAEPKVVLRVQDDGTGMDAETRKRIFEPFFTTKGPGEGTGLGLSMVYGVVSQCGGSIHVDSELGRGTTITLTFPLASFDEEPTRNLTRPREIAEPKSRVILLVEDEKGVRVTLERTLVDAGYQVIVASDGDEALHEGLARIDEIDLMLSDVVMPTLSGPLLAERLLAVRPELPVILMSGYSDRLFAGGSPSGTTTFLQKPFMPEELVERIAQALVRACELTSRAEKTSA